MVDTLSSATRRVQKENKSLEKRLAESTSEVQRLRDHLEQVRRDATTDGLTNLANRRAFDDELARACTDADVNGMPLTLAVLDIDHFKNFNDTWGHQTGDQVIRYVASVIGRLGATPRFSARYGGEEFAMIFPGEDAGLVEACLQEIREEVASRMLKRRRPTRIWAPSPFPRAWRPVATARPAPASWNGPTRRSMPPSATVATGSPTAKSWPSPPRLPHLSFRTAQLIREVPRSPRFTLRPG